MLFPKRRRGAAHANYPLRSCNELRQSRSGSARCPDRALETLRLITSRRARRRLSDEPIAPDVLLRILEAARWAPSCANNQPWKYYLCTGQRAVDIRAALLGGNYWADNAPAYLVAAADKADSCRLDDEREYALLDLGFSVQNLLLQAHAEGLIAHPMAGMKPLAVKEILGIPENYRVMALISLAWPGTDRELSEKHEQLENSDTPRKPLEELLFNPEVLTELRGS
jgi:nitroreductase